jgi:hypothetical protein
VLRAIAVGVGATLFMDVWAVFLKRALGIVSANYCLVGRWFCYMPQGTFTHTNIADSPKRPFECAVGWFGHYVIGGLYALLLVAFVSDSWLMRPTLLPALLFGVGTLFVPFLVMHPAFGLGVAASKAPNRVQARLKSLMAHTAFGIGLYVSAVGLNHPWAPAWVPRYAAGGGCFSTCGNSALMQAQLGAHDVQIVTAGFARFGSSNVPTRTKIR